ncbi:MAG: hypothetical protein JOY66_14150 [Acetobacteraceae bacterium]|nr:hypothetical protein [Acetobacteraceae bacterium]
MSSSLFNGPTERRVAVADTPRAENVRHVHRRVSWQALFAGVILAVAVQLLLTTLGVGVGLGLVGPTTGDAPDASSIGIGAGVWWFVSNLVALGIGGYAAAWLSGVTTRFDGVLHGLITWGIATLFAFWVLTTALGGLLGCAFSAVGTTLAAAGSGIRAAAPQVAQATGVAPDSLQSQAQAYLQPADPDPASMSPQDAQKAIATTLPAYLAGGPGAAAARERIIAVMAGQMRVSHDAAAKRFDEVRARAASAKTQAVDTARTVAASNAGAVSTASFMVFGVLLLDAIAAAAGGALAVRRRARIDEILIPRAA